jgi:hypothetical protein
MWSTITPDGILWRMCKILRVQRNPLSPHHGERGMVQKHSPITSWSRLCQTSEQRGAKKRSLPPEVRSIVKSLKVKKLSGVDDITNKMIKRLRDRAVINAVLRRRGGRLQTSSTSRKWAGPWSFLKIIVRSAYFPVWGK